MTRFNGDDDHRRLMEDYNSEQEEEEALSLCDLPIKEEVHQHQQNTIKSNKVAASLLEESEEFEFGSWVGSVLTESEICVADEVFFQGQILPLRHSVSSDNGFSLRRQDSNSINPSRSESMDRSSSGVYTSSRSSSSKSHNSITSTSTSTTTTTTSGHYKPLKNIFHSHPSPKPQIWNSNSSKSVRRNVISGRTGKTTTWGLFRVGLVKTPQIELQDLRLRNYKSFNSSGSSSGSSNKSSSIKNVITDSNGANGRLSKGGNEGEKKKMQRFYLFESCKCSIDAVESTVSSNIAVIKSSLNSKKKMSSNGSELMKEEVITMKKEEDIDDEKEIEKEKKEQGKKQKELMNHLRTFEWLKELSVADVPD
ncbi:hypothetical protein MKW94_020836 [Papaver nudicaule]|uniref:Uncharacterized protein n=1 Tax=Papaver nudicaule TaxID=74823 RepID=A0AA41VRU9_PAPNU|nr:hypothetical protein [Papaver nudicaule]